MNALRAVLLVLLMLAALCAPCTAQEIAFGGRGEDRLTEVVGLKDGGLFAVGKTASTDGDLSSRTRSGETGWAIRIGADGRRMWNYCTAKSGMYEMTAPHAYADGRFSLLLTDETAQRGEWIVLLENGRQQSRVALPQPEALCPMGEAGRIAGVTAACCSTGPYLAILCVHEQTGELCCSALLPDGGVHACGTFYGDASGVLCTDAADQALYVGMDMGALAVTRFVPGRQMETTVVTLENEMLGLTKVTDALCEDDGSLVALGQTVTQDGRSARVVLRVNAQGEILFVRTMDAQGDLTRLTQTQSGYAMLDEAANQVLFIDEDGAMQGGALAPEGLEDLVQGASSLFALVHKEARGAQQAALISLEMTWMAEPDAGAAMPSQTPGAPQPTPQAETDMRLGEGHLRCSDNGLLGVTVTRVGEDGAVLWQTRTPIHTAADRLVWEQASLMENGDVVLTGYYETQGLYGNTREKARAVLSADGVLRQIGVMEEP